MKETLMNGSDILRNIEFKKFSDSLELCRCLGVSIKDVKLQCNNIRTPIDFKEFRELLDCCDVCEQCLTKESNKNRVKVTLEEVFLKN